MPRNVSSKEKLQAVKEYQSGKGSYKVISEKYNDKDVLLMDELDLKGAVEKVLSGQLGNIDVKKLPTVDFSLYSKIYDVALTWNDIKDVRGKIFRDLSDLIWYPISGSDYEGWFSIYGSVLLSALIEYDNFENPTEIDYQDCLEFELKNVVANPTLAGTESALEGLQVGDATYKVESGTKLYKHEITVVTDSNETIDFEVISTRDNSSSSISNL